MSVDNPAVVLVDVSGSLMAVTSSLKIPVGMTGLLFAGVGSDGIVRYPQIDSTSALRITGSAGITGSVSITSPVTVTSTGSLPVTWSAALPVNVVSGGNGAVQGFNLTGSTITANPLFEGFEARTSDKAVTANSLIVGGIADSLGKQVILLGSVPDLQRQGTQNYTTASGTILVSPGASNRFAVMSVLVTNAHATVSTKVVIKDGLTTKIQGYAAAAGGGFAMHGGGVPLFITTVNTPVSGGCITSGADVDITVSGYLMGN